MSFIISLSRFFSKRFGGLEKAYTFATPNENIARKEHKFLHKLSNEALGLKVQNLIICSIKIS